MSGLSPLFVPGRLCLLGEHSDWAAGYRATHPSLAPGHCLVAGTDQGLHGRASRCDVFEIESRLPDGSRRGPLRIEAEPAALRRAAGDGGFMSYAAGVAALMCERYPVSGLRLEVFASDLPIRGGLSSSAAICVLVARSFDRVYGLGLSTDAEMELAYEGERRTGSECGRMDQVCAYGRRASFLRFDGDALEIELLEPGRRIDLLIVDLRRGKDTRRILADLNACYPATAGARAARVREALGPRNAELLGSARAALLAGDALSLGALMREAQARFDADVAPACPELAAPRLHEVLAADCVAELTHGGKGVGSQGDGCAQLVARGPDERELLTARLERDFDVRCLPLTLRPDAVG